MAYHTEFGEKGEEMATNWLTRKGFTILHRNWRQGRYEVDIIALRKPILHFIEVKSRRSMAFGLPEENVSHKKIRNMMKAAATFLYQHPCWKQVQYDVLAISRQWTSDAEKKVPEKKGDPRKEGDRHRENDPRKEDDLRKEDDPEKEDDLQKEDGYEYFFIEDISL